MTSSSLFPDALVLLALYREVLKSPSWEDAVVPELPWGSTNGLLSLFAELVRSSVAPRVAIFGEPLEDVKVSVLVF